MNKRKAILLTLALLLSFTGCKRYVCPTYHTAFHLGPNAQEDFFSMFKNPNDAQTVSTGKALSTQKGIRNDHGLPMFKMDTTPKYELQFVAQKVNKNGLISKKKPILARITGSRKQNKNIQKIVHAKITIKAKDSTETVVFDNTLKQEKTTRDTSILGDAPPEPAMLSEADLTSETTRTDSVKLSQPDSVKKKQMTDAEFFKGHNWEQYVYNETIGKQILAHVDSMRPKWAEEKANQNDCPKNFKTIFGLLCPKNDTTTSDSTQREGNFFSRLFRKKHDADTTQKVTDYHDPSWYEQKADTDEQEPTDNSGEEFDSILKNNEKELKKNSKKYKKEEKKKEKERAKIAKEVEQQAENKKKEEEKNKKEEEKEEKQNKSIPDKE
jgi:hypothetical protein